MFGINLKVYAIVAGLAFAVGTVSGWRLTSRYYVAKISSAEVKKLQKEIKARDDAALEDSHQAVNDRQEMERLKEANRELQSRITAGQCFSRDDTSRLRDYFDQSKPSSGAGRSKGLLRK